MRRETETSETFRNQYTNHEIRTKTRFALVIAMFAMICVCVLLIGAILIEGNKPSPAGVIEAMSEACFKAEESAFAGDQIFTDTLAANLSGVVSIAVRPLCFSNPFIALRYGLEAPFRAAGSIRSLASNAKRRSIDG